MSLKSIACAVIAFNRPKYLKAVLRSLSNNKTDVDWFFFLDGSITKKGIVKTEEERIKEVRKLVEQFPRKKEIITSEYNIGIARQKRQAHSLFSLYDHVLFFEDDMVVSPYYIDLLIHLQNSFPESTISASDKKITSDDLNLILKGEYHLWGYSLTKENHDKINWAQFDEYIELCGDDYTARPHQAIFKKFNFSGNPVSSHDGMLAYLFNKNGISQLSTAYPRGINIGKIGMHFNEKNYPRFGLGNKKICFPSDKDKQDYYLQE